MRSLVRNVVYGLRMLRKSPGVTAAVIATLMLGIGATTAIYTVVYAVLLAPMPYPNPEQLVMVWSKVDGSRNAMSAGDFLDWKEQNHSFQQLAAFTGATLNLATQDQPEPIEGMRSSPGWFDMQGIRFFLGRDFLPEEGIPGKTTPPFLPTNCGTGWAPIATFSASPYESMANSTPWWACWRRVWAIDSTLKWRFRWRSLPSRSTTRITGC